MRQRQSLERAVAEFKRLQRDYDDARTLIELGEAENDDATIREGEAALNRIDHEAQRRSVEAMLSGEADAHEYIYRSPRWGRRHREPGLGLDAGAHVRALGRAAWLQGEAH